MDENMLKQMAENLRKPEGEFGKQTGIRMNTGNKLMNLHTLDALKASPKDSILELGMGNGFFIKDIVHVDTSIHYTGCDFSGLMIEEATTINKEFIDNGQVNIVLAS